MKVWSAEALAGLLANIPKRTTGFVAALIRRAASLIAALSAGPGPAKAGGGNGSVVIHTANNAQADRTFNYVVIG